MVIETLKNVAKKSIFYKFYLRSVLLRQFPISMNIELTNRCNLKCVFCPRSQITINKHEIDWDVYVKFIDDIKKIEHKYEFVPVGLGELFLYSRWKDALSYYKKNITGTPLHLVTNGTLIDEAASIFLCSLLGDDDSVLFSLNTWDSETYKKMMNVDCFEGVINNILRLLKYRNRANKKFLIKVQFIKTQQNQERFKDFWGFWLQHGAVPYLRELENWGGKISTGGQTLKHATDRYPCYGLWVVVMIDAEGYAYPCCEALSDRGSSNLRLGNIMENSVEELFSSTKYRQIQRMHLAGQWNLFPECINCDLWSSMPNVWIKIGNRFI